MSIIFKPNGALNIAESASDLPESVEGNTLYSESMTRCKNLRINQQGKVTTRDGSTKLNTVAINTAIYLLVEQRGTRYAFAGDSIYQDESAIASGLTEAQWSAILYNAFNDINQQVFALNGTDRKRIQNGDVFEWGIDAPDNAPILSTGIKTGLTGDYNVKYTYARKVGSTVVYESNPSPDATNAQTLSDNSLQIICDVSDDSQVTHVRIYRTLTDGVIYYYDQDFAVDTTEYDFINTFSWESSGYLTGNGGFIFQFNNDYRHYVYSWEKTISDDNNFGSYRLYPHEPIIIDTSTADASLGSEVETDHNRPPLGSYVKGPNYNGTCFIIKDNNLHYCKPKQPEYWPANYFIEICEPQCPGQVLVFYNGQPYYLNRTDIYYIQGTGHGTFFPLSLKAKTGAQGIFGAISVHGKGIFHTGQDGIYLFSDSDRKITEAQFEPLFRGETTNGMPGVESLETAILHYHQNHVYFCYQSAGYDYPTNVIIFNLITNRTAYYIYNDGTDVQICCMETDDANGRLLIGDNTGFVRVIEDLTASDDSGTAISWEIQSKDFTLQTRAHFPRWVKYDVDASNAASCTGSLLLDDVIHQTHALTQNRKTKRRLVKTGNGEREALRITGSGEVSIYAVESE